LSASPNLAVTGRPWLPISESARPRRRSRVAALWPLSGWYVLAGGSRCRYRVRVTRCRSLGARHGDASEPPEPPHACARVQSLRPGHDAATENASGSRLNFPHSRVPDLSVDSCLHGDDLHNGMDPQRFDLPRPHRADRAQIARHATSYLVAAQLFVAGTIMLDRLPRARDDRPVVAAAGVRGLRGGGLDLNRPRSPPASFARGRFAPDSAIGLIGFSEPRKLESSPGAAVHFPAHGQNFSEHRRGSTARACGIVLWATNSLAVRAPGYWEPTGASYLRAITSAVSGLPAFPVPP